MPHPRHSLARAATAAPARAITLSHRAATASSVRSFSSTSKHNSDDHGQHYDPPSGWLWGAKPGEEVKKEAWENVFIYGMFGALGVTAVLYAFKPDTSIQTWALEEARRRLEVEGILKEPEDK